MTDASNIARGRNAVHILPADWDTASRALAASIDHVDLDQAATQMLVLVATADAALAVTQSILDLRGVSGPRVVAATGAPRVSRVLRAGAAPIVVGAPAAILALLRTAALKLDAIQTVAIAWVEDILADEASEDLESILADLPKDAARIVITTAATSDVDDFVERHARRAPRTRHTDAEPTADGTPGQEPGRTAAGDAQPSATPPIAYVVATGASRRLALRQILDEIDPPSATVYVRSDDSEREVRHLLSLLGYTKDGAVVQIARDGAREHATLLVLYDTPRDLSEWRAAIGSQPARIVALLGRRLVPQLQTVSRAVLVPMTLGQTLDAARAQEAKLRAELRRELASGTPPREALSLEPLLGEFDGVALAAAALRLLERERRERARAQEAPRAPVPPPPSRDRPPGPRPGSWPRPADGRPGGRSERGHSGGPRDRGPRDSGPRDSGSRDRGPRDTGPREVGPRDRGPRDSGPRNARPLPRNPR